MDRVEKCFQLRYAFFNGSRALFMGPASTLFSKKNFKTESHGTIHTFKNYFVTIFSVFSNKRCVMRFSVGPMHYSWDPQVLYLAKKTSKLSFTVLFTHLKIILLQYFQFSVISGNPNTP